MATESVKSVLGSLGSFCESCEGFPVPVLTTNICILRPSSGCLAVFDEFGGEAAVIVKNFDQFAFIAFGIKRVVVFAVIAGSECERLIVAKDGEGFADEVAVCPLFDQERLTVVVMFEGFGAALATVINAIMDDQGELCEAFEEFCLIEQVTGYNSVIHWSSFKWVS